MRRNFIEGGINVKCSKTARKKSFFLHSASKRSVVGAMSMTTDRPVSVMHSTAQVNANFVCLCLLFQKFICPIFIGVVYSGVLALLMIKRLDCSCYR